MPWQFLLVSQQLLALELLPAKRSLTKGCQTETNLRVLALPQKVWNFILLLHELDLLKIARCSNTSSPSP